MLDRVLGRAELKDRIDELEDRVERQQAQVESAKESRAEAVSARQRAEEEVNRLEDRIAELEDRVARVDDEGGDLAFRHEELARGDRIREVADRLRSLATSREGALTAYVADENAVPDVVREQLGDRTPLVARAAPCLVCVDDAGLVATSLSLPVAPDPFTEWADGFRVDPEWVRPVGRTCFALVRSDLFAGGVYEDGERVSFEAVESDVMNDHSKGGFSQARFERRRDSQIAEHVEESREVLCELAADADRVILVGDHGVLTEMREGADVTAAVDASGAPEEALAEAFDDFWSVRIRGL
jgi:peptide subunit release factor 1 (eRF1)